MPALQFDLHNAIQIASQHANQIPIDSPMLVDVGNCCLITMC